jgi:hypothetical protein
MAMESGEVFAGFFDNHVDDEDAIDAGLLGSYAEILEPETEDGIVVGEDDEAGVGTRDTEACGEGEDIVKAGAMFERALAGPLDDGAIGEWIAEGDPELEDVSTSVNGSDGDVGARRKVGIADGDVGDEAGLVGETDGHRRLGSQV